MNEISPPEPTNGSSWRSKLASFNTVICSIVAIHYLGAHDKMRPFLEILPQDLELEDKMNGFLIKAGLSGVVATISLAYSIVDNQFNHIDNRSERSDYLNDRGIYDEHE